MPGEAEQEFRERGYGGAWRRCDRGGPSRLPQVSTGAQRGWQRARGTVLAAAPRPNLFGVLTEGFAWRVGCPDPRCSGDKGGAA
jgi:hypothetical protein